MEANTVTITIGEGLRLVTSKSERITELLSERMRAAWGYEETKSQVRLFSEVCENLRNEVSDRIELKTQIAKTNLGTLVNFAGEEINLQTANLQIDFWRKEVKSLKQVLEDPTRSDPYSRRMSYHMQQRTTEDVLPQPFFELDALRAEISEYEVKIRELDSLRNKKNWEATVTVKLYYA